MSYEAHKEISRNITARCAVITLSDTRTIETDVSGKTITQLLVQSNHSVVFHEVLKDQPEALEECLRGLLERSDVDAILTTGGTGISRRDQTIGVVDSLIEQPLPGFGELFRLLSYQQIGSGAMLSRASGGIAKGKLIFAMPGSPAAVELAMTELILPELRHLLHQLRKCE
jgi:molybdenum cofactor biosynthesis protein B